MKNKALTKISISIALLAFIGPIAIPIGPLNISLALFIVLLLSLFLKTKETIIALIVYYYLIFLGVPIGTLYRGGISFFINPWFGYYIGFLFCPIIIKLVTKKTKKNF